MIERTVSSVLTRIRPLSMSMMCVLMSAVMAVWSTPVMAQEALRPPKTDEEPSSPKYLVYIVAVLLVAVVVFVASMRSKRTHQD